MSQLPVITITHSNGKHNKNSRICWEIVKGVSSSKKGIPKHLHAVWGNVPDDCSVSQFSFFSCMHFFSWNLKEVYKRENRVPSNTLEALRKG